MRIAAVAVGMALSAAYITLTRGWVFAVVESLGVSLLLVGGMALPIWIDYRRGL
jgi:hypothetical protein